MYCLLYKPLQTPPVQALTYRLAEGNKLEEVEEKDRLYLSDAYKLTVLQAMSVPQLIDTILINPTVNISPSYRDTGEAGGVLGDRWLVGAGVVSGRVLWLGGCLVGGCWGCEMLGAVWLGWWVLHQWVLRVSGYMRRSKGLWPEAGNPYKASSLGQSLFLFIVPCRCPLAQPRSPLILSTPAGCRPSIPLPPPTYTHRPQRHLLLPAPLQPGLHPGPADHHLQVGGWVWLFVCVWERQGGRAGHPWVGRWVWLSVVVGWGGGAGGD